MEILIILHFYKVSKKLRQNGTYILGIESSCDDTSAAVIRGETLLSNVVASQKIHEEYGGVVPELASRAHQQNIIPVVDLAIRKAGISSGLLSAHQNPSKSWLSKGARHSFLSALSLETHHSRGLLENLP